jgi:O-antigen ligase
LLNVSFLQTRPDAPLLTWLWWALAFSIPICSLAFFCPFYVPVLIISALVLFLMCINPMFALCAVIAISPICSCALEVHFLQARFLTDIQLVFYFELLCVILLPALIVRFLLYYHSDSPIRLLPKDTNNLWILYLIAAFTGLSAILVFSYHTPMLLCLLEWWKLISNFIIILIVIIALNTYGHFIIATSLYCCIAALWCIAALASTYYAFIKEVLIFSSPALVIFSKISLFNRPSGVAEQLLEMSNGYGLLYKHEFAVLIVTAGFFSIFLFYHYKSLLIRSILAFMLLLYTTVLYTNAMRTSIAASILIVIFVGIAVGSLRRYFGMILLICLLLNLGGWATSYLIRPPHLATTDEVVGNKVKKLSTHSRFEPGSMYMRRYLMGMSIRSIMDAPWSGHGPQSSRRDLAINVPHAHNIILTFMVDYGIPAALLIVCAFLLVFRHMYNIVFTSRVASKNLFAIQVACTASAMAAFFEYSVDCDIFVPLIWIIIGFLMASIENSKSIAVSSIAPGSQTFSAQPGA